MQKFERAALLILDGWGLGQVAEADAIAQANTPFFDGLMAKYPHSRLITHGEAVGLPDGQMGNSEVGHLNIGAGRVVYQELARINKAARTSELAENKALLTAIEQAKSSGKGIHLMGLVSDGGVHSHISHLLALCDILQDKVGAVYIHAFTDGRDTDPKSGVGFLSQVLAHIEKYKNVQLATVIGRYYAMDRDKRWERVKLAYDLLTAGVGQPTDAPLALMQSLYNDGITDEFMPAIVCQNAATGQNIATIGGDDVLICFNFRTDRCREISQVLTQTDFADFGMKALPLRYFTMARYDETFKNIGVLFEKDDLSQTLGEVLAAAGKSQVRIAETEKYPHVTFFFSGGREQTFEGETRLIVPSAKVATYDLQPEMSAREITTAIRQEVADNAPNFICLNYANADMVGHTGVFAAAMRAAETVDNCLSELVPELLAHNYAIIIIADHGNSDYMRNPDGSPNTAHSTNPVPCILATREPLELQLKNGKLADVAPTILHLLGLDAPAIMDGEKLI